MTKTELIRETARLAGVTQAQAEKTIAAALDVLADTLVNGDRVKLQGFGSFIVKERTITGRDFQTNEVFTSHTQKYVYFDASEALRAEINT